MLATIRQRPLSEPVYEQALASGYSPLQARVIAARLPDLGRAPSVSEAISPSLSRLDPPSLLPDIAPAVDRIVQAIERREQFLLVTDHDADGGSAHAVLLTALSDVFMVPRASIHSYISHRLREGYGVSDALVDRMLSEVQGPALMITADQGSTDEARIARLRARDIETIVTDHHEIPTAGIPASAVACVNPTRSDSSFPDKTICGCHVAWLVMCAVREALIQRRFLPPSVPKLSSLADYVALAAVADCVDLARSANNRAIVRYGLHLINTQPRPAWRALKNILGRNEPFTAETLSHQAGPRVNSAGRLDDAMRSVDFLLAKNDDDANRLGRVLDEENVRRRDVQAEMLAKVWPIAQQQAEFGAAALVLYSPEGHPGVHGIVSSRLVESFGRPTVCFSPKQGVEGTITGSFRSVPGVHIRNALVRANELAGGDLYFSMGGHVGAAGASLAIEKLPLFQDAFRRAVAEQRDPRSMGPVQDTDGAIDGEPSLVLLAELTALEPYGREFPAPVFEGSFVIKAVRSVGDGRHLKLELVSGATLVNGIWFAARESVEHPLPVAAGQTVQATYTLSSNTYRGQTNVDLKVQTARVLEEKFA